MSEQSMVRSAKAHYGAPPDGRIRAVNKEYGCPEGPLQDA
jgi:hypothetical protein